jgi:transposase
MLVLEAKLQGKNWQYELLGEAIRTVNFVRNKALRYWMDNRGVSKNDLQKLCATLAKEFEWAGKLNSQARQASADRAWAAISRFYKNCQENKPGKKGYPRFKRWGTPKLKRLGRSTRWLVLRNQHGLRLVIEPRIPSPFRGGSVKIIYSNLNF